MKKGLKILKRIFIGVLLILYLGIASLISTLLLNKNDFGVTQFKDKTLILVDRTLANDHYKENSLVIVRQVEITELEPDDEVFVYQKNDDNTVKVVTSQVELINTDDNGYYFIQLKNNGGAWGQKYVAGVPEKVYENIGGLLLFIETKWTFFIFIIVPGFFILLYEVYLIIITIKYGDEEYEAEERAKKPKVVKVEVENTQPATPTKEPEKEPVQETPVFAPQMEMPYANAQPNPAFAPSFEIPDAPERVDVQVINDDPLMMFNTTGQTQPPVSTFTQTVGPNYERTITQTNTVLPAPTVGMMAAPGIPNPYQAENRNNIPLSQLGGISTAQPNVALERTTYVKEAVTPVGNQAQPMYEPQHEMEITDVPFADDNFPSRTDNQGKDTAEVEDRLEQLLKEVSKLRDELNNK